MTFDRAVSLVLRHEGGYSNDARDPGGETRYGISKRAYPGLDIANLTQDAAREIYRRDYWQRCRCDELPWPLALYVFDCAVNQGVQRAIRTLQACLRLEPDGIIGPVTLQAARHGAPDLGARYMAARAVHYSGNKNFETYGAGWFTRLFATVAAAYEA